MECRIAQKLLSAFMDDALGPREGRAVSGHLEDCTGCRADLVRLERLRGKLGSLERVNPPDYLRHLLQTRLDAAGRRSWVSILRNALEYRWSVFRSTEGLWYGARLAGTAAACVLLLMIAVAVRDVYTDLPRQLQENPATLTSMRQQLLAGHLLKNLGLLSGSEQMRLVRVRDPGISNLYLLQFGEDAARSAGADSFSVLARVDRSGSASIEGVLEYPADRSLLSDFSTMIQSARCRPASHNGKAVSSHLVLTFNRIEVSE